VGGFAVVAVRHPLRAHHARHGLAHRPKPKSKAAKKRKRLKTKIEKERKHAGLQANLFPPKRLSHGYPGVISNKMLGYSMRFVNKYCMLGLSYFLLATDLFVIRLWLLTLVSCYHSGNLTFFYQSDASAYRRFSIWSEL
jgi:hypothetical protein